MLDVLKSYLVNVGFNVNNQEFSQTQNQMKQLDSQIKTATKGMATSFATAASTIIGAIASINAATASLVANTANADLQYQKFALRMWTTKETAKELKTVMDTMGESMEDIAFIPELRQQFQQLSQMGRAMSTPADASGQLKFVRSIGFEFTRMKLEASYAMEWISYYITKYLSGPLGDIKKKLKDFNDMVSATMPQWTSKVAKVLIDFMNLGLGLIRIVGDMYKGIIGFFEMIPAGARKAILGLGALWALMIANPIVQMMTVFAGLVILIEDFYGYIDGRKSSNKLAPIWQKLIDWFYIAKDAVQGFMIVIDVMWNDLINNVDNAKKALQSYWDEFTNSDVAKDSLKRIINLWELLTESITVDKLLTYWDTFKKSEFAKATLKLLNSLFEALEEICEVLVEAITEIDEALVDLFGETLDNGAMETLVDLFTALLNAVSDIILGIVHLTKLFVQMWKAATGSAAGRAIWKWFKDSISFVVKLVAYLGRSFFGLFSIIGLAMQGKFKEAAEKGRQIFSNFKRDMDNLFTSKASAAGRMGGSNGAPTNQKALALAEGVSERTGIPANLIYAQWAHETGGFTNWGATQANNFGGMKQFQEQPSWFTGDATSPEGDQYQVFNSAEEYADYFAKYLTKYYPEALKARTPEEYAQALKQGGYYGASVEEYTQGLYNWQPQIPINNSGNLQLDTNFNPSISANQPTTINPYSFNSFTPTPTSYMNTSANPITIGDIYVNSQNATPQDIYNSVIAAIQKVQGNQTARQIRDINGVLV